ncbi:MULTISPECIES: DUF6231 family protein [Acinetobacter]|uniref:DUF6231 family protein n=1 Tax=Acinetobacter TaxID=469 RepID=UPI001444766E|nr:MULTISPECIES: DUF6231 family protein [Acinetobacter]
MADMRLIQALIADLSQQQPISTALCVGQNSETSPNPQNITVDNFPTIACQYFSALDFLNLPFTQRFDLGIVFLDSTDFFSDSTQEKLTLQKSQVLVKLRDLLAKRIIVIASCEDAQLLRALGFTQLIDHKFEEHHLTLWQFNILTYKHVPDWFNSKFWANPENWDKFRW